MKLSSHNLHLEFRYYFGPVRVGSLYTSYFPFGEYLLTDNDKKNLDRTMTEQSSGGQYQVVGHTDSVGTREYNQKLSEKRAQAVNDYLIQHGWNQEQITVSGEAFDNPAESNDSDAGREKNRRVEVLKVTKK